MARRRIRLSYYRESYGGVDWYQGDVETKDFDSMKEAEEYVTHLNKMALLLSPHGRIHYVYKVHGYNVVIEYEPGEI